MPSVLNIKKLGRQAALAMIASGQAVYICRGARIGWRQGKWHNPFIIPRDGSRDEVIAKYRAWIVQQPELMAALPELRGKDLLCWCLSVGRLRGSMHWTWPLDRAAGHGHQLARTNRNMNCICAAHVDALVGHNNGGRLRPGRGCPRRTDAIQRMFANLLGRQ